MKCKECSYCDTEELLCTNTCGSYISLEEPILEMEACPLGCKIEERE